MKLTTLSVAVAATTLMLAQSAQARGHHRHHLRHQAASGHHFVHREARRHHIFHSEARRHYLVRDREAAMQAGRFEPAWNSEGPDRDYAYAPHRAYRGRNAEREDGWLYPQQARGSGRYARRRVAWENGQEGSYGGGYGRRPSAWCGWEMRHLVSSDPGPSYNLARNWAHWGHGGAPGVGAVVVWPHHVGKIVGRSQGQWIIQSGNDGHRMRTRPRSIGGAIAIRWG
jgi:hypothetical protein